MSEIGQRMLDGSKEPSGRSVTEWVGPRNYKRWTRIVRFIEANYPGVFVPNWLYGGKKFGWALRFKKSKSFCSLIPEKNRFKMLLVFGGKERSKGGIRD